MTRYFVLILAFAAASALAEPDKFVSGIVNVNNELNVRVKPGKQYFIVSTLKRDATVKIYRKLDDWYEIAAPADSSVWVAGHLMANSRTRRVINLRAGPSEDYQAYRSEPPGVELEIIERKGHGGWFKVKPPVDLKAWVNSRFIIVDEYKLKELLSNHNNRRLVLIDHETGNFSGFLKKHKNTKPTFILPFVRGTDRKTTLKGQIIPLKSGAVYVTHALIKITRPGEIKPVAYLHCRNASLNIWKKKLVNISGTQKLVRGWKLPVVEVKTVIPEYVTIKNPKK
ncbi:MAG: SH3 domain-containing protein [Victivallaceae bacterium]|nr:SH3 domain-containing protein [Victivallaceae bacterium]